jgi:inactivated superfamily I helicase
MNTAQIARLRYQPDSLPTLLAGLTEAQIRQRPQPDKWAIFEQMAHLGRYQQVFTQRLRQIVDEENPVFSRYVAEDDPGFAVWLKRSVDDIRQRSQQEREGLLALLSGYPEEVMQRRGSHPTFGVMTICDWTEFFLLHEAHHLFAIMKLAAPFRNSALYQIGCM